MMLNFKKLLGLKSDLGKEIHKKFELEQKDTLFKQVDFLYNEYKVLAEKATSLDEAQQLVKDLWLTIEMVMTHPAETEMGDMQEGMMVNGLRVSEKQAESPEGASATVEETSEPISEQSDATKSNESATNSGIIVFKDVQGNNRWMGIVSNNYTDRHAEIISKEAHLDFVNALKNGEYPYPPLLFHHDSDFIIGKSDYVNYDEQSGMLVASGTFDPLWAEIGDNLAKSEYSWGMSHGMPPDEIMKYPGTQRIYKRYRDAEFTLLRLPKAANAFTSMS